MFKDAFHALQQTLLVLRRKGLGVTLVGVRKGSGQCITGQFLAFGALVEECTEVCLVVGHEVIQRKVALFQHFHNKLLLVDIPLHAGVASSVAMFLAQAGKLRHAVWRCLWGTNWSVASQLSMMGMKYPRTG